MKLWNVFLRGNKISQVSFIARMDAQQIKDEMVGLYGWHSKIVVVEA